MKLSANYLDELFMSYNYVVSNKSNNKVRIYTLRYGMYHAAEILLLDEKYDISKIKSEYSELGYATEVKIINDQIDLEEYLFEGFFIKTPLGNELKDRYRIFLKKQLINLPPNSNYKYIQSAYDLLHQDEEFSVVEHKSYNGVTDTPLLEKINHFLTETKGAIFIIIEAAAGFGKTCTANEVLNTFSTQDSKKLPFFTELSRNREARVFKHILLNEIDKQFPSGIKQNIVIDQITKGRIPLIIDGFDELITKESNKEEVESMLATIVDLLRGEAKIIITSRKTAIFNSDEFINSIYDSDNCFSLARFEIKEPTIENWLDQDRLDLIATSKFPIDQMSNPVLLAYLRNISIEKLTGYLNNTSSGSLVDKYVNYLLEREQVRQNLKLDNKGQLKIFRKLMRFMTEYNVTAESKETIKDFIKEYNQKTLRETLKNYIAEEKPSIEDLVETLSNHVFLDRKSDGNLGFINDFIFGLLVGENLVFEKYQKYYPDFHESFPQDFAQKSIESFKVQSHQSKIKLWEVYNSYDFKFDVRFYFDLDYEYTRILDRKYENLFIGDVSLLGVDFGGGASFLQSVFSNMSFHDSVFDLGIFKDCSFRNCSFYNCSYVNSTFGKTFDDFALFACDSNNDFVSSIFRISEEPNVQEETKVKELTDLMVLRIFFGVQGLKPKKARKLSHIRPILSDYTEREINKVISKMKNNGFLTFKDDVGFISKKGIQYYNLNKTEL